MSKNKFIQFELWKDCNNGCKFCFNHMQPLFNKLDSIIEITNLIHSLDLSDYSIIGFMGGEFFDNQLSNPQIKDKFYNLVHYCLLNNKQVYITTALLFKDNTHIYKFLDFIKYINKEKNILLCTSYDTWGRFHTIEQEDIWKSNMKSIHNSYPNIEIHTETILTEDFIDKVLSNKFNIKDFETEYNTHIDYIEPQVINPFTSKESMAIEYPEFFPKRKDFLKFLSKCYNDNSIDISTFLNPYNRSNTLYIHHNKKLIKIDNRQDDNFIEETLSTNNFNGYIDSNIQMWYDVEQFKEVIG